MIRSFPTQLTKALFITRNGRPPAGNQWFGFPSPSITLPENLSLFSRDSDCICKAEPPTKRQYTAKRPCISTTPVRRTEISRKLGELFKLSLWTRWPFEHDVSHSMKIPEPQSSELQFFSIS